MAPQVVSAFEVPYVVYDPVRRLFFQSQQPRSMLGDAKVRRSRGCMLGTSGSGLACCQAAARRQRPRDWHAHAGSKRRRAGAGTPFQLSCSAAGSNACRCIERVQLSVGGLQSLQGIAMLTK